MESLPKIQLRCLFCRHWALVYGKNNISPQKCLVHEKGGFEFLAIVTFSKCYCASPTHPFVFKLFLFDRYKQELSYEYPHDILLMHNGSKTLKKVRKNLDFGHFFDLMPIYCTLNFLKLLYIVDLIYSYKLYMHYA